MSLRSPLGRVLGLGAAKEGPGHWWAQRLTAIALAPLGLWFIFSLLAIPHGNYQLVAAWIADPAHAIMLILLLVALVYHSSLGLQVVVEDYVRGPAKVVTLIVLKFVHVILATGGLYAILVISIGAGR